MGFCAGGERPACAGGCVESPAAATPSLRLHLFKASTLSASASPWTQSGHRRRTLHRLSCATLFFIQRIYDLRPTTHGLRPNDQRNTDKERIWVDVSKHVSTSRDDVCLFARSVAICQMLPKSLLFSSVEKWSNSQMKFTRAQQHRPPGSYSVRQAMTPIRYFLLGKAVGWLRIAIYFYIHFMTCFLCNN